MIFLRNRLSVAGALLILTGVVSGNCLALGQLGLPAPGTISGTEVKSKVADSALIGVALGVSLYCSQFSNASSCESFFSDARTEGMALAFATAPQNVPVDESKFYGEQQGTACADAVLFNFWFLTSGYLGTKEEVVTVNGSSVITIPDEKAAVKESVLLNVALAGGSCQTGLDSTGSEGGSEGGSSESESSEAIAPLRGTFRALE